MLRPDVDWGGSSHIDPQTERCMKLWADVMRVGLVDAARDFAARQSSTSTHSAALIWMYSDSLHIGSFEWLCALFGFDPDAVRSRARMNFRGLGRSRDVPSTKNASRVNVGEDVPDTAGLSDDDEVVGSVVADRDNPVADG